MALKPIAAGDSIISIPRHLMVSCVDVCNDDVLKKALERTSLKFTSCELLAVFLLYHAKLKEGSLWKPYVESLPTMFHVASSQAEVELYPSFIASPLSCQLSILEVARRKISCVFKHIPGNTQNISPSDITWSYMAVNSRTVYLKPKERCLFLCPDDDGSCALAPFLDFLNHSCEASVSVELDVNDMYQIVTHVPYAKYDQIFISYGPHDNVKLFVEYGFFLPNNPHDGVPISMEDVLSAIHDSHLPDSLTTSLESKKSIASSLGEASNMFLARDGPSWSLTTVVKILLLRDDQIGSWQLAYEGANADNEAETRIIICIICSARQLLKDSLMKMMNLSDKSQHLVIGCTLVQEYVRLVDDCLAAYEKR
ncbi:SET domain-containing protein 4-like [Hyalella azteca]|uniref:SET domain-containing protein 4-like n=1 Tax=Hyalella azteca TaxID=294128 RepID=A0A8B7NJJ8_HYAAZ|nr:SET domain-containing protein 4-like [Hyalella azteca]